MLPTPASLEQVDHNKSIASELRILAYATQGTNSYDAIRLRTLLQAFKADFIDFRKDRKKASFVDILLRARASRVDLIVMEGTGVAGGFAAMLIRLIYGIPYVFSSGDAIAPFLSSRFPLGTPIFWLYERLLHKTARGFIGWTPYLTGRALTLGVPQAVTAAGWAPYTRSSDELAAGRMAIRSQFGIPMNAVVFGLAGSLTWSSRFEYCYGMELIKAASIAKIPVYILIVGDGSGLPHLREMAGALLDNTIFLPGRVDRESLPDYLAAMDIASLPQSVDQVGSFRYTTKLSEYLEIGLPFITTEIPLAYDLDCGNLWRLPGQSPWDPQFVTALAVLMSSVDHAAILAKKCAHPYAFEFDREQQIKRITSFLQDIGR